MVDICKNQKTHMSATISCKIKKIMFFLWACAYLSILMLAPLKAQTSDKIFNGDTVKLAYIAPPVIEHIRVDFTGKCLLNGTARPLSSVRIYIDERFKAVVQANEKGDFAAFFEFPEKEQEHIIELFERTKDNIYINGQQDFYFKPSEMNVVFVKLAQKRKRPLQRFAKFFRPRRKMGEEMFYKVDEPQQTISDPILIENIDYEDGKAIFKGSGTAHQNVQLYINDIYRNNFTVGSDGKWAFTSDKLSAGQNIFTFVKISDDERENTNRFHRYDDKIFVREIEALPSAMRKTNTVQKNLAHNVSHHITQSSMLWKIPPVHHALERFYWRLLSPAERDLRLDFPENISEKLENIFDNIS